MILISWKRAISRAVKDSSDSRSRQTAPVLTLRPGQTVRSSTATVSAVLDARLVDCVAAKQSKPQVDGTEIGLNVPVKIAFRDEAARDLFMSIGPRRRKQKTAAVSSANQIVINRLVTTGAVQSPLQALMV